QRVPSSKRRPMSVMPCGTRRGGLNFGSGFLGSGGQWLRASETLTNPARSVSEGWPVKLVIVSISSRKDGTSNKSTCEKMGALSLWARLRRSRVCLARWRDRRRRGRKLRGERGSHLRPSASLDRAYRATSKASLRRCAERGRRLGEDR